MPFSCNLQKAMLEFMSPTWPESKALHLIILGDTSQLIDEGLGLRADSLHCRISEGNDAGSKPFINIVGYIVGNGVTDSEIDSDAFPSFAAGKSLISNQLHSSLVEACGGSYFNRTHGEVAFDDPLWGSPMCGG